MDYKLSKFRLTIPQEIREHTSITRDGYISIEYDESTGSIIIKPKDGVAKSSIQKSSVQVNKEPVQDTISKKKIKRSNRKIEANFMNADKLYKAYYSECGLVAKTKTRYVNDFCEECRGQLAKEWEDRVEVRCKYLSNIDINDIKSSDLPDEPKVKEKPECKEKQDVIEDTVKEDVRIKEDINDIKNKRKDDLKRISDSIKKATKVIDNEIESLSTKPRKGRPKKQKRYSTASTVIRPIYAGKDELFKCCECGEFFRRGFMLDDEFLCKECTKKDFKEYMNRRCN